MLPPVLCRRPLVAAAVTALLAVSMPLGVGASPPTEPPIAVPAMRATREPLGPAPAVESVESDAGQDATSTDSPYRSGIQPITVRSAAGVDPFVMIGVSGRSFGA